MPLITCTAALAIASPHRKTPRTRCTRKEGVGGRVVQLYCFGGLVEGGGESQLQVCTHEACHVEHAAEQQNVRLLNHRTSRPAKLSSTAPVHARSANRSACSHSERPTVKLHVFCDNKLLFPTTNYIRTQLLRVATVAKYEHSSETTVDEEKSLHQATHVQKV